MGMTGASKLDRAAQFERKTVTFDAFNEPIEAWANLGSPVPAHRADVKDSEKFAAGQVNVSLESRFTVRSSSFTRGILPTDRVKVEGQTFEIKGIKEAQGRRQLIELSCARTL